MLPALINKGDGDGDTVIRCDGVLFRLAVGKGFAFVEGAHDEKATPMREGIAEGRQFIDGFGAGVDVIGLVSRRGGRTFGKAPAHLGSFALAVRIQVHDGGKAHGRDGFDFIVWRGGGESG